jgi:hypothetical protein
MDPVPDHYFSENLVAPGIEPGTSNCRKCYGMLDIESVTAVIYE